MKIDLENLGGGGLLAGVLVGIVSLLGLLIRKNWTVTSAKIAAEPKNSEVLNSFVRELRAEIKDLKEKETSRDRREYTVIQLLATMQGELRVLNGLLGIHLLEVRAEEFDGPELERQVNEVKAGMELLINTIEGAERELSRDIIPQIIAAHSQLPPARRENLEDRKEG